MRWRLAGMAIISCLLAAGTATVTGAGEATAAPLAAPWGTAQALVLPPVINFGQFATINSIACPTAGNCTAVGHFTDAHGNVAAIAASEVDHVWAAAVQPFGTIEPSITAPDLLSVSCSSPGNCAAVGVETVNQAWTDGLLLGESNGTWNSSLSWGEYDKGTTFSPVSCPPKSAGACTAGGYYVDASGKQQALLLTQSAGPIGWSPITIPGLAGLNAGGSAAVGSVSCPSKGDCAAGGYYTDGNGNRQAFTVTERNGAWKNAREVAGALNSGGHAQVNSMSCASGGNCVAAGQYFRYVAPNVSTQAFEATEKNGTWSSAQRVPGTGSLNAGGVALVNSVSCVPGTGSLNCALGGRYQDKNGAAQSFVDVLKNGSWKQATEIGSGHNLGGYAQVSTVSCPSAGNCAAGGSYLSAPGSSQRYQAFVVSLKGFAWQSVKEVPGTGALNAGKTAQVNAVSCPSSGFCAAGGFYSTGHLGDTLPFVADGSVGG